MHAKNKRLAPTGILRSEDSELPPTERRKLLSATRTLHRNFSVAAYQNLDLQFHASGSKSFGLTAPGFRMGCGFEGTGGTYTG